MNADLMSASQKPPTDEIIVVAQLSSHVQLSATPWTISRQASLSLTISQSLTKFMFIVIIDTIQPSHPLTPSCSALDLS